MNTTNTANYFFCMYHYHYVNSHMPGTDPGTSEPGGVIELLGSGDYFDTPSHALCFCSLRSQ